MADNCYIVYKGKNYTQEDFLDYLKSLLPTKTFTWARRAENSYEVSSKGDTRFSALNAKLKDGRTIEEAYQLDVKGYRAQGDNWRLGKGKAPIVPYYTGLIKPEQDTIFVFGSNPEGRHGAGAAKVAKEQFGAIYGQGEGLQGNAYALPTKDLRIKENKGFKSISPEQITENIKKLYEVAKQNPTKKFKIGYTNTTEKSLNGYTGFEMIEMFNNVSNRPSNIIFSKEWVDTGKLNLISPEQSWQEYKSLWETYLNENPDLEQDLREKAKGKVLTDMFAFTDVSQARALAELLNERSLDTFNTTTNNPSEFINHSGGAIGSDTAWDEIGREFGMVNNKHYWTLEKTPNGNTEISRLDYEEGRFESARAAKRNFGYQYAAMKDSRLIRNWSQVKHSDAVFAIGTIAQVGEKVFPKQSNDTRLATNPTVTGGTGYAVGMAINHNKPVYVFDQNKNQWYTWNKEQNNFIETDTPTLTKNFAGIGTREINENGKQAIRNVYEKTFNKPDLNSKNIKAPGFVQASEIYNKLGNKTVSKNVKIVKTYQQAGVNYAKKNNAIFSLRVDGSEHHFGNPFSPVQAEIDKGLIPVKSTREAVEKYIDWVINSQEPRAKWIREQLDSGALRNKDIIYYKELGEPSHATALDYLINNWEKISKATNPLQQQSSNNETSTDTYQYYGAKYEIITVDGVGVQVKNYKGSHQNQQKLLQAYNINKDVDPQNGKKFRNLSPLEELEQKITGGTSDTLNLSKYELFPGVYANEGQRAAIDAIEEFFAGDKDQFLLKGRGGTGKTTIVKKTLEQFDKSRVKILGSTISYEAKNVLQDNMQGYKTATLASVLGLIPDYAKDGSMFFREKTLEERMNNSGLITPLPIETVDILIVDEASMIDEFIYNKLLELKKPRTKILFMGDNVQIPPINSRTDEEGNVIEGENSDSPVWQLIDSGDYVELSERMRQGAESPILPITDLYAKNVEEIQSGETGLKNPLTDRTSNFQNNEGVLFTSDVNEVVNQFVEDIEGSTDIREAVIVGARNAVVDDMNLRVRKKLFETKEPFVIGDSIRINSPHVENNEVIFENGLRAKVKDVYELPEDNLGLKRYELEIEYIETNEKGDKFIRKAFLKTISPQDQKQYKNKLREMAARAKSFVPKTPESKKAWKEFFDIKSSTVDVGYGYAITSHKVQGSTYNSAYVLEGDIMSFPGGIEQTNRMMYTAVSRPRKKLVIFNPSVVESQQVSQPKIDIRAKVYELFNLQGYMDIKTSHKTDKNLITAISHYVLEDLGYKTDQEKLQAVREGFKLSEYITTEQISDVHTRVRLNMKNIIEDEVDDGPVSLGGIKFTSSGYESEAENAFKTPTLDLSTKVTSFLETLNFEINTFENLKEVTGYDAEAATDLLYKMVLLKNTNKIENNLVKEAAYVAISLLGKKNKIRTDLLQSIDQLDNYPKLYEEYKNRSSNLNDYKIKELILVDLVADSIYENYNTPKDSYINRKSEYWSITGNSKFEKKLKYYINRIKKTLEDLFGTNKLSNKDFNDLLSDISRDILDNNISKFNTTLSPEEQLTNYEETIKEDKGAENIIKTFQDLGLYLTGSLAIRKQGSLYRSTKENLHDLDFTVPTEKSSEEIQKILDSIELPKLPFIEYLVSPEDIEEHKLEQLTKYLHKIDLIKDIKKKYPTYEVETIFKGLNPGEFSIIGKIDDYAIDLFLVSNTEVSDSNSLGFQNWQDIFLAKLKMGRHKDIKDLVNFKAYNKNLNTKLAQTKGVRHFNFKNNNTIEQAFTCK